MAEEKGIENAFKFRGYKQPSAYAMGRNAFENAVKGAGFADLGEFNKYLADKGIGRVGKDPNATVELNRIRAEKNIDPYTKINPTQAAAEREAFGNNPKETRGKRAQMNIRLNVISKAAENIDGDTNKFNYIIKKVSEEFPQLAKKTVMSLTKAIFMGAGPSMIAADLAARRPPRPPRPRIIWALLRTLISATALSCLRTSASTSPPFANTYLYAPAHTDLHYCVLLLNEPAFGHFLLPFNLAFDTTIISPVVARKGTSKGTSKGSKKQGIEQIFSQKKRQMSSVMS